MYENSNFCDNSFVGYTVSEPVRNVSYSEVALGGEFQMPFLSHAATHQNIICGFFCTQRLLIAKFQIPGPKTSFMTARQISIVLQLELKSFGISHGPSCDKQFLATVN